MGAEDVEALWEDVIVDEASVDGPDAHHEDDVAPSEEDLEDLRAVNVLLQLLLLRVGVFNIDIDIFKNDIIDIYIDIFRKCQYIDNRYGL